VQTIKMKNLFENWRKHVIEEKAELKIPVEKYDAFKRKIEQWGMLFNKFTGYTRDLNNQSFDRKTDGKRIVRMAHKLESEFRKIMKEFDFDAKSYDDERHAMRQKLDRFDGDSEFFLEQEEVDLQKLEPVADSVVAVVEKELDKVPETEQLVVMQAVISKLQALMGGGE
jgi:hypothetical protein